MLTRQPLKKWAERSLYLFHGLDKTLLRHVPEDVLSVLCRPAQEVAFCDLHKRPTAYAASFAPKPAGMNGHETSLFYRLERGNGIL
jgi:hypothetical protein